jgi:hypothetical protein
LVACQPTNLCFKETPRWVQEFHDGYTVSHLEGNVIFTECNETFTGVNATEVIPDCEHECRVNGELWACPETKCCVPQGDVAYCR